MLKIVHLVCNPWHSLARSKSPDAHQVNSSSSNTDDDDADEPMDTTTADDDDDVITTNSSCNNQQLFADSLPPYTTLASILKCILQVRC